MKKHYIPMTILNFEIAKNFLEVILAKGFDNDALKILKNKKNLRIIDISKFRDKKIYVKSNYTKELENCILITCGSKKTMQKIFNLIKETLKNEYNHYRR